MSDTSYINDNLHELRRRVSEAAIGCGRSPGEITLVGVSKTFPAELVSAAIACGLTDIGENRVQEARDKRPQVVSEARWHLIGPLQTNKAKYLPGLVEVVHTLCRVEEAEALERAFSKARRSVEVLVQVNVGREPQKSGLLPEELLGFLPQLQAFPHLQLRGLMTIPPHHDDPELERPYYRELRELREVAQAAGFTRCTELSMGMSHDFEVAIQEGATLIRVGTALFGKR